MRDHIVLEPNCSDCGTKLTRKNATAVVDGNVSVTNLCMDCNYRAELENAHQDGHHYEDPQADCMACKADAEVDDFFADVAESNASHTEPTRKNRDHSQCTHPRTPAGRAACRKGKLYVSQDSLPTTKIQRKKTKKVETNVLYQLIRVKDSTATSHYVTWDTDRDVPLRACNKGEFKGESEIIFGKKAKCRVCQVRIDPTKLNSFDDEAAHDTMHYEGN